MTVQALRLRPMKNDEAQVRRRLGKGLKLDFQLEAAHGTLSVHLLDTAPRSITGNVMTSGCGPLLLSDAEAFLSLISSCPAMLPDSDRNPEDSAWYWQIYNQYLSPELQALFVHLEPAQTTLDDGLECLLEARINGLRICSRLRLAPATLLRLLDRGNWRPPLSGPESDLPLCIPLLLGRTHMSAAVLRSLRQGDIVFPEQAMFAPDGQGPLQIGGCRLGLQLESTNPPRFIVTELEETAMNAPLDHLSPPSLDHLQAIEGLPDLDNPSHERDTAEETLASPDRFADLPLALTLRMGSVSLKLSELRNLAIGSVLIVEGSTVGNAMLCHGERPLAHGELVDVEGRLGLQITRLEQQR
ncbi:flagellar motor switch/type III secretory pathway protein [Pseudomonas sp. GM50]|uniref:FliM/FliN family flagellar motor switch protein n=1 Tax=Pseudomonas sp. GM50 TaxID=1144332 RepID=UPI000270BFDA|nr:FliM/FliN family flagellar motor switch protein [Pseudomonas sp. GM50]EJM64604.1 flagellar motor switch/type III secretory pathway protein [Pseudomonas sp. GM50]